MQTGSHTLKNIAVGTSVLLSLGHSIAQKKPNIILIMTDQQTANAMSNRGNPNLNTPAMDQLANDGVTFTRAYCAYPLSGPSRASIMTGKMPNEVKVHENGDSLSVEFQKETLGFKMQDAGYDCLYAGKWHIPTENIPDNEFGFKKLCGSNDPEMAIHIEKALSEKRNKPFFLVASYLNPHEACEYARFQTLHYGKIDIPEDATLPPLPDNFNAIDNLPEVVEIHKEISPKLYPTKNYTLRDWQNYLYAYNRLVERVDVEIEKLLQILKDKGLYENTMIILTSDHGDGVGAHQWNQKRALFEETMNIPLIIKPSGKTKSVGTVNNEALINIGIDIYPTICDYAEIKTPQGLNGLSIRDLVQGKTKTTHESIFVETNLDGLQGARGWAVIKGNFKYVFYRFFKNKEQLFNLNKDKGETTNLIDNPSYKNVYKMMKDEMLMHAKRVNDEMLIKDLNF